MTAALSVTLPAPTPAPTPATSPASAAQGASGPSAGDAGGFGEVLARIGENETGGAGAQTGAPARPARADRGAVKAGSDETPASEDVPAPETDAVATPDSALAGLMTLLAPAPAAAVPTTGSTESADAAAAPALPPPDAKLLAAAATPGSVPTAAGTAAPAVASTETAGVPLPALPALPAVAEEDAQAALAALPQAAPAVAGAETPAAAALGLPAPPKPAADLQSPRPSRAASAAEAGATAAAADPAGTSPSAAILPTASQTATQGGDGGDGGQGDTPAKDVKIEQAAAPAAATGPASVSAPAAHTPAAAPQATPQTISHLAAQIVARSGSAKTTQFDVALDPQGLGRVNVSLRIAADGTMSAAMSFDTPQAAAELRARSDELQRALSQAGFNVADGGLTFDVSGDSARQGRGQDARSLFELAGGLSGLSLPADTPPTGAQLIAAYRASRAGGVDIRI